jgi:hypothetical protein
MKGILVLIILICAVTISSCSHRNDKNTQPVIQNQTPEVLENTKSDLKVSSFSKRYEGDIIQELFNEALSKDEELKTLSEKMAEINTVKNDSLESYRTYIQNNNRYWSNIFEYINQISDSTIKIELRESFKIMESKYLESIKPHDLIISRLDVKSKVLNDREILMKIIVTQPMMYNYQRNELPAIKPLKDLANMYDELIKRTQPYTIIKK